MKATVGFILLTVLRSPEPIEVEPPGGLPLTILHREELRILLAFLHLRHHSSLSSSPCRSRGSNGTSRRETMKNEFFITIGCEVARLIEKEVRFGGAGGTRGWRWFASNIPRRGALPGGSHSQIFIIILFLFFFKCKKSYINQQINHLFRRFFPTIM